MERVFNVIKLVSLAIVVVVALLCLSFAHAYGYSAAVGIGNPSNTNVSGDSSQSISGSTQSLDRNWDQDSYVSTADNSDSGVPPSTVPEPGTLVLLGTGFLGLARYVRRRG